MNQRQRHNIATTYPKQHTRTHIMSMNTFLADLLSGRNTAVSIVEDNARLTGAQIKVQTRTCRSFDHLDARRQELQQQKRWSSASKFVSHVRPQSDSFLNRPDRASSPPKERQISERLQNAGWDDTSSRSMPSLPCSSGTDLPKVDSVLLLKNMNGSRRRQQTQPTTSNRKNVSPKKNRIAQHSSRQVNGVFSSSRIQSSSSTKVMRGPMGQDLSQKSVSAQSSLRGSSSLGGVSKRGSTNVKSLRNALGSMAPGTMRSKSSSSVVLPSSSRSSKNAMDTKKHEMSYLGNKSRSGNATVTTAGLPESLRGLSLPGSSSSCMSTCGEDDRFLANDTVIQLARVSSRRNLILK